MAWAKATSAPVVTVNYAGGGRDCVALYLRKDVRGILTVYDLHRDLEEVLLQTIWDHVQEGAAPGAEQEMEAKAARVLAALVARGELYVNDEDERYAVHVNPSLPAGPGN